MPTNLPKSRDRSFMLPFLWAFVFVPLIYGIAAYEFISYEKSQLDAYRSHGGRAPISAAGLRR